MGLIVIPGKHQRPLIIPKNPSLVKTLRQNYFVLTSCARGSAMSLQIRYASAKGCTRHLRHRARVSARLINFEKSFIYHRWILATASDEPLRRKQSPNCRRVVALTFFIINTVRLAYPLTSEIIIKGNLSHSFESLPSIFRRLAIIIALFLRCMRRKTL